MSTKERIEVKLELYPGVDEPPPVEPSALTARITSRASEIVADLGLPLDLKVMLREPGATSSVGDNSGRQLTIDGTPCRKEMDANRQGFGNGSEDLPDWVAAVLHANREHLITSALLNRVYQEYGLRTVALLPEMVRRGIRLERVVDLAARSQRKRDGSDRYKLELILGSCFPSHTTVEAGPKLHALFTTTDVAVEMLTMLRDGLFYDMGMRFPSFRFVYTETLGDEEFRVRFGDLRDPVQRTLLPNEFLVNDTSERLSLLGLEARDARNPINGVPAAIVTGAEEAGLCESAGLTTWDQCGYAVLILSWILRSRAHDYLTVTETQNLLSKLSEAFPLSIVDLLERFSPIYIAQVLRLLVQENCSIRDLRSIMEAMMEINGRAPAVPPDSILIAAPVACLVSGGEDGEPISAEECAEYVRRALKRYLTFKYAPSALLNVVETTAETEGRFGSGAMALDVDTHTALVEALASALAEVEGWRPVVIVTSPAIRRNLRRSLAIEFPHIPVLSRDEIDDSVSIQNWGMISFA